MDAAAWDQQYQAHELKWGREPNRFVRQQCERLPIGDALDLACGEGRNAVWLATLGWRVTGVDFSSVAIERACRMTSQQPPMPALRLTWKVQDVSALALRAGSIDLALASYVHLPPRERDEMLLRAAAALRPAGHLVIVGHDERNLAEGVSGPQDLDLLYSPHRMRTLLSASAGLTVEVARTVERPTPEGVALDTVVRARRGPPG
ncbi:MAG: class I SAM-dependent methyltransferase [Nocardioidaceae bacterium]